MKKNIKKIILKIILIPFFMSLTFSVGSAQHYEGSLWINCTRDYTGWKTFLTDVNGDGRADIVCWNAADERADVLRAKEETNGFYPPAVWVNGSANYKGWQTFMADVTGDGRADIILWNPSDEKAVVLRAKSEGLGFEFGSVWINGSANYTGWKTYMADANGDGKADIILWNPTIASAVVITAKAESFGFNWGKSWVDSPGNYSGSKWQTFIGDVTGDGRADIVVWGAPYEKAVVFRAKEEGNAFYNGAVWLDGPANYGSDKHNALLVDVSGDGRADIVDWDAAHERAVVWRAKEDGNGYGFYNGVCWLDGPENYYDDRNAFYFADATGDGRADIIDWNAAHASLIVWKSKQIGEGYGFKPGTWWADDDGNLFYWKTFIADVNGDKRSDIIAWYPGCGKAQVWIVK